MTTITTITRLEKDRLDFEIDMCLKILYKLEDITMHEKKAISDCIDLLQSIDVCNIYDNIEDVMKEVKENE